MATKKKAKLTTYVWEGKDRKGDKVKGEMLGNSPALIKAELRKQGIMPKRVRKKPMQLFKRDDKRIRSREIALFTRQLATMMRAGVPLVQAFSIVAEGQDNKAMREVVTDIRNEVASGTSVARALRKHPKQFDDLYCSLVAAGEQSGALETMLDRLAIYQEKHEALKAKIRKALVYPAIVLLVAVVVSLILLVKVVPQFESLFQGFGAELPGFTLFVLGLSDLAQQYWQSILAGLAALLLGTRSGIRRSPAFAAAFDRLLLRLPIVGQLVHKSSIARFSRTLATTFAAGVPLVEALDSAADSTGNAVYARAVRQVREDVATGQQMHFSMRTSKQFPSMVIQMVEIGEESGALDTMLDKVADFYEEDVDNIVSNLSTLIEPMVIGILGVLIGGLVIAMYLPIFQLGSIM